MQLNFGLNAHTQLDYAGFELSTLLHVKLLTIIFLDTQHDMRNCPHI